jgi:hypothetical protein
LDREVHRHVDVLRQRKGRPVDRNRRDAHFTHNATLAVLDDRPARHVEFEPGIFGAKAFVALCGSRSDGRAAGRAAMIALDSMLAQGNFRLEVRARLTARIIALFGPSDAGGRSCSTRHSSERSQTGAIAA